jgi:putative hydroxymethylpyrimidine transport system substrate-binding protein
VRPALILRGAAALAAALAACTVGCGGGHQAAQPVRLVLDFTPNAAHAGIYAATHDGRDRAHGVHLAIREPSASTDSLKLLAAGRAELAVLDIHDLGLARERGEQVVGVGALVQRPLAAVIAGPGVTRPRELEGRRVGVTGLPSDDAVLRAVVQGDGGSFDRVRRITIGFSAVPSLVARKVAAATAFWSVEGVTLRARGVRTSEFRVDSYGAPRYPELVVVTTAGLLKRKRDLVRRTLAALEDGTRAALAHPGPVVAEISRAGQADPGLVRRELAAVRPALTPPLRLDRSRLDAWAAFDTRFGILRRRPDVAAAFDFTVAP